MTESRQLMTEKHPGENPATAGTAAVQQTISRPVEAEGVGVHSGQDVRIRLEPAEPETGIVFVRSDLSGSPEIPVRPESINPASARRMTVLETSSGGKSASVGMIEHLLATCAGLGVSNLRVVINGAECPIFDGSARRYVQLIREAGLKSQDIPLLPLRLEHPIGLIRDHAEVIALPADRPRFTFFGEFRHRGLPDQQVTFEPGRDDFAADIAPARTFCFWEEIEALRDENLIQGGSLDCALVLRDGKPLNGEYRLTNELARHKLLDLMGDLAVLGRPVAAWISARASGHALHHEFVQLLMKGLADD